MDHTDQHNSSFHTSENISSSNIIMTLAILITLGPIAAFVSTEAITTLIAFTIFRVIALVAMTAPPECNVFQQHLEEYSDNQLVVEQKGGV